MKQLLEVVFALGFLVLTRWAFNTSVRGVRRRVRKVESSVLRPLRRRSLASNYAQKKAANAAPPLENPDLG